MSSPELLERLYLINYRVINIKELNINLSNCYGIKKLTKKLNFDNKKLVCIYAPNGSMKTSFANTLRDIKDNVPPKDRVTNINGKYSVKIDFKNIYSDQIFIVDSFQDGYESEKLSDVLINPKLKKKYDSININLVNMKSELYNKLKNLSGCNINNIEKIILADFSEDDLFKLLINIYDTLNENINKYDYFKYNDIFDDSIFNIIKKNYDLIEKYIAKFDELYSQSMIFKKNIFNPYNAETIFKSLDKNNFFKIKNNKIILDNYSNPLDRDQLNHIINSEIDKIYFNSDLIKIKNEFKNNLSSRLLEQILLDHPEIILKLSKKEIVLFKQDIWKYYLFKNTELVKEMIDYYIFNITELKKIEQEASETSTLWNDILSKFKDRFFPPYEINLKNIKSTILGVELPKLEYILKYESRDICCENISNILSTGEKRALYILNIIFDIESLKINTDKEYILIFDDVADSFDYKNKYAIIEYLKEISEIKNFYLIILTHNFDFFRTVQSRIDGGWKNYYTANRCDDGTINIDDIVNQNIINPFNNWRDNLSDYNKLISMIPFVRELISYSKSNCISDSDYIFLTKLLHFKKDSKEYKISNLIDVFKKHISNVSSDLDKSIDFNINIFDLILKNASELSIKSSDLLLHEKVVLSIGIRLQVECYMLKLLNQINIPFNCSKNQTYEIYNLYKNNVSNGLITKDNINLISAAVLLTPQNIHLNSFMYEPILDMGSNYLKQLFINISQLGEK